MESCGGDFGRVLAAVAGVVCVGGGGCLSGGEALGA